MPPCVQCGKTLASAVGLRRHINSQHQRSEWHVCDCGRQFLDPAARSRCRAGHSQLFACPLPDCHYQKDCVKQHLRRRHRNFTDPPVLTLRRELAISRHSSTDEEVGYNPVLLQTMMHRSHHPAQSQAYAIGLWHPQPSLYYLGSFTGSWSGYH